MVNFTNILAPIIVSMMVALTSAGNKPSSNTAWHILTNPKMNLSGEETQSPRNCRSEEDVIKIDTRGDDITYVTYAEFELLCEFVEAVAGNKEFEMQYEVASVVLNRVISRDYPNYIDEVIWQKGNDGLWKYLPADILLDDIIPSDSVYEAVTEALFIPSDNDGTDMGLIINGKIAN